MTEYIERTEELVLAMNAGARAIENTRRYHGAVYIKDLCSEASQERPHPHPQGSGGSVKEG